MNTNASRPIRRQDDDFFTSGNDLSYKNSDMIISYIAMYAPSPVPAPAVDENGNESESGSDQDHPVYPCCAPHCNQVFDSIFDCEEHYIASHIFECSACSQVLPNDYLLDLVRCITVTVCVHWYFTIPFI